MCTTTKRIQLENKVQNENGSIAKKKGKMDLTIIDTYISVNNQYDGYLKQRACLNQCDTADAVILVFDINNPESLKNIEKYWLRAVKGPCRRILVGNKVDGCCDTRNFLRKITFF